MIFLYIIMFHIHIFIRLINKCQTADAEKAKLPRKQKDAEKVPVKLLPSKVA